MVMWHQHTTGPPYELPRSSIRINLPSWHLAVLSQLLRSPQGLVPSIIALLLTLRPHSWPTNYQFVPISINSTIILPCPMTSSFAASIFQNFWCPIYPPQTGCSLHLGHCSQHNPLHHSLHSPHHAHRNFDSHFNFFHSLVSAQFSLSLLIQNLSEEENGGEDRCIVIL